MISDAPHGSRETWLPAGVFMALIFLTELGGAPAREWLQYDRAAVDAGQWWRLVTCSFVHLGGGYHLGPLYWHWFLNELGLVVYVLLCPERISVAAFARRVLVLAAGMGLALHFLVPGLSQYVGMSGVIHGLFVLGLVPQVLRKDLIALCCLAFLLGKVAWELVVGAPVSDEAALGGRVLVESHLYGSLSAFLYGVVFRTFWRPETFGMDWNLRREDRA